MEIANLISELWQTAHPMHLRQYLRMLNPNEDADMPTIKRTNPAPAITAPRTTSQPSTTVKNGGGRSGSVLDEAIDVRQLEDDFLRMCIYGRNRVGKCLGRGTPVLMFDGSVIPVECVMEGDVLMGPDSKPRNVISTASGVGPLYSIIPTKGDSWVCNDAHILTLAGGKGSAYEGQTRDVSVTEYLREIHERPNWKNKWFLTKAAIDFSEIQHLPLPPYLVGLWMGDGTRGVPAISNNKQEIQDYCRNIAEEFGMICTIKPQGKETNPTTQITFRASLGSGSGTPGGNKFLNFFRTCTVGELKTIPRAYLTSSRKSRSELLAGIIDTDGESTGNSCTFVTVTGEPYKNDLLYLCWSLGLGAWCSDTKVHVCANGKVSTYYSITICGDLDQLPTKVREFLPRRQNRRVLVSGFEIEDAGDGEYFGFEIDGDGRFLLGDFTVTHNTFLACKFKKPLLLISFEPARSGGAKTVKMEEGVKYLHIVSRGKKDARGVVQTEAGSEKATRLARELQANCPFATVVIDTITSYQDLILQEILDLPEVPEQLNWGMVGEDQYRQRSERTREALRPFMHIDADTIFLAQEKDHNPPKDRGTSKLLRGLQHESFFAADLGGATVKWLHDACDYIAQLYHEKEVTEKLIKGISIGGKPAVDTVREVETGRVIRRLRTMYATNFAAGFRSERPENVPMWIDDPTAEKIYAVVAGERIAGAKYEK